MVTIFNKRLHIIYNENWNSVYMKLQINIVSAALVTDFNVVILSR